MQIIMDSDFHVSVIYHIAPFNNAAAGEAIIAEPGGVSESNAEVDTGANEAPTEKTDATDGTEGTEGTEGASGETEGTEGTEGASGETEGTEGTEGTSGETEGTEGTEGTSGETEGTEGIEGASGGMEGTEGTGEAGGMDGMEMGEGMEVPSQKPPLMANWFFVMGISTATFVVGAIIGILLAKRKIKKGIDLYED